MNPKTPALYNQWPDTTEFRVKYRGLNNQNRVLGPSIL